MENQQKISNRNFGSLNNILLVSSALLIVYILVYFKYYYIEYPLHGIHVYLLPVVLMLITIFSLFFLTSSVSLYYNKETILVKYFHFFSKQVLIQDIAQVKIVNVNPLSDFLGIGYRISNKYGTGIISGDGKALFIELKNNKKLTFSIEDNPSIVEQINQLIKNE